MADTSLRELAGQIHVKALELSARAAALADHAAFCDVAEVEFVIAMIEESESAINYWSDEIKKAARK